MPPQYIIIVDSGSTESRISIFKSTNTVPFRVNKIFPTGNVPNTKHSIPRQGCDGGIQCSRNLDDMKDHLRLMLTAAHSYLGTGGTNPPATAGNTVFYLLATGGMRQLGNQNPTAHNAIIRQASNAVNLIAGELGDRFPTTRVIRTITGQQEGWFAWSGINYGQTRTFKGIVEMGGASVQYAFKAAANSAYVGSISE